MEKNWKKRFSINYYSFCWSYDKVMIRKYNSKQHLTILFGFGNVQSLLMIKIIPLIKQKKRKKSNLTFQQFHCFFVVVVVVVLFYFIAIWINYVVNVHADDENEVETRPKNAKGFVDKVCVETLNIRFFDTWFEVNKSTKSCIVEN